MATEPPIWEDLNREILGLKGAILGAKAALLHGGRVDLKVLWEFKQIAERLSEIVEDMRIQEIPK